MGEMLPPFTVNPAALDTPPEFVTVIASHPAEAISEALMDAVNCVVLTNVVILELPLKFTVVPGTKLIPFTVSVNAEPPAIALAGKSEVIVSGGPVTVTELETDAPL
jgi:hypothetical protein